MDEPTPTELPEVIADSPTRDRLLAAILVILVLYTCAAAATLIVPVMIALLLSLMLAPAVRVLCATRLPRSIAALLIMACVIALIGGIGASLATPAQEWLADAPRALGKMEQTIRSLQQPFRHATEAGERLAELTGSEPGGAALVMPAEPSMITMVLQATPALIGAILLALILTFIFLLHGDSLLRKLVEIAPALRVKKEIVLATRSAQYDLSIYMVTITVINIIVGLLTALIVWWLGVPNALLWGAIGALFNYAPYVGPFIVLVLLTLVGFGHFDSPWEALSLPGMYLLLNIIEGQLLTPLTVGRRLALDPVVVFVSLATLGWLWGVPGVLLALPLMTCIRIIAEHVSGGETVAKILRRADGT